MMASFLERGRRARGLDLIAGWTLRLLGGLACVAGGLAALAGGALVTAAVYGVVIAQHGDPGGGVRLVVLIAALGAAAAALAAWLGVGAHRGFAAWRERRARPVRLFAWSLAAVGATFWAPFVFLHDAPPGQLDLLWLRVFLLAAGLLLWAWAAWGAEAAAN